MYQIHSEKYEDRFVFVSRNQDNEWFFLTHVKQYYVRGIDMMGHVSPWLKISGKFYSAEQMTLKTLKDEKLYIHK